MLNLPLATKIRRIYTISMLLLVACFSCFTNASAGVIPPSLQEWVPWVLKNDKQISCPSINNTTFGVARNHLCAWPSTLTIHARDKSADFSQSWQVLQTSWLPLPGNRKNWPLRVTVNQTPFAITDRGGVPSIRLDAGTYQVAGSFSWQNMPETIAIPDQVALVDISANGEKIAFAKRINNQLWLKEVALENNQADFVKLLVTRKVADGPYIKLESRITLNVAGKIREESLGKVLPQGFKLIGVSGDIPAFLDAQGVLKVSVKPGRWQVVVYAYAPATLTQWQRPSIAATSSLWPKDEVWVFEAQDRLRLGKISGGKLVDANMVELPSAWRSLPSYLLSVDDALNYKISHRGKPLNLENSLFLKRNLWLSFDQDSFSFSDSISGDMLQGWRLSMAPPYLLGAGEVQGQPALITSLNENERGMEVRYRALKLAARGSVIQQVTLPITGWQHDFERVDIELNLPPAHHLFAVFGADYVSSSWWSYWTIWTSFIVLLAAIFAARSVGVVAGAVTLLMLLFTFQETGSPVMSMINLLLAFGVSKYQPFKRLDLAVKVYFGVSLLIAAASILFFSTEQIRQLIHPQLEQSRAVESFGAQDYEAIDVADSRVSDQSFSKTKERYSRVKSKIMSSPPVIAEHSEISDSKIQAGAGIPSWRWNQYTIRWQSPVAKGQEFRLIVLDRLAYSIFKGCGIILMLLWLYLLVKPMLAGAKLSLSVKDSLKGASKSAASTAASTVISLIVVTLLLPGVSGDAMAASTSMPNQALLKELKAHLLKAPACKNECASVNQLTIDVSASSLHLSMQVHAQADTAIALPRSKFWRPQYIEHNGQRASTLIRQRDWLYFKVKKGINHLEITGEIASVDSFELQFKQKINNVQINHNDANESWDILGLHHRTLRANSLEFVATAQKKQLQQSLSTRYKTSPFVKVSRTLNLNKQWTVQTTVQRIAPAQGALNISIALLDGERVLTPGLKVQDNQLNISFGSDQEYVSWSSTFEKKETFSLVSNGSKTSKNSAQLLEHWIIIASAQWHVETQDLVSVLSEAGLDGYFRYEFFPHAGESLTVKTSRPDAVVGDLFAVDGVLYELDQGARTSTINLSFSYRSTRGGEHVIDLPQDYQLKKLTIDGHLISAQASNGKLALPVAPGKHQVLLQLRKDGAAGMSLESPTVNLNSAVSNITSNIILNNQRWVLWTQGPLLGPAVIYWGELLAFILIALFLAKVSFSPLNTVNWLILGIGLSLNSWGVLMLIVFWFGAITASKHRPEKLNVSLYNISQTGLYVVSVIAILSLVIAIPSSLLGNPDMGIIGNDSYGNNLRWFSDQSSGLLPSITVFSLPILVYKGVMLLWVMWLCFSILGWIKWAWNILGQRGYWQQAPSKKRSPVKPSASESNSD